MRTTIRIDDQLLKEAKLMAAKSGKSLTSVIEDALREVLSRKGEPGERRPVSLMIVTGQGFLPGVDLDDSAALLDLMESSDDSD